VEAAGAAGAARPRRWADACGAFGESARAGPSTMMARSVISTGPVAPRTVHLPAVVRAAFKAARPVHVPLLLMGTDRTFQPTGPRRVRTRQRPQYQRGFVINPLPDHPTCLQARGWPGLASAVVVARDDASVPQSAAWVVDRLTAFRRVSRGRLSAQRIAQGGVQLLRFRRRQQQRGKGDVLPGADDLKRQRQVTIPLTAQTATRNRPDLPPL
jgi:hypothetical protein